MYGNFPIINPYLTGMSQAAGIRNTNAQTEDIENRNTPDILQQKLLEMQLANKINEAKANYADSREQQSLIADKLANRINEVKANYAEPTTIAGLEQTRAGTNLTNEQAKYLPLDKLIAAQNSLRANQRFGSTYQFIKALGVNPIMGGEYLAQHPSEYNQLLTNIGNSIGDKQQNLLTPEAMQQLSADVNRSLGANPMQMQAPNQQISQAQLATPQNMQVPEMLRAPQNQQFDLSSLSNEQKAQVVAAMPETKAIENLNSPAFSEQTPEQKETLANVMKMNVNKKVVSSPVWTRAESAAILEKWLADNRAQYQSRLQNVAKYAGMVGKGKRSWDSIQSESPQAYQDYKWFKDAFVPNILNQVKMMEKMGATDSQREELHGMLTSATEAMDLDPKSALKYINRSLKTMGDIGNSVIDIAEPVHKGVFKKVHGLKDMPEDYVSKDMGDGMIRVMAPNGMIIRGSAKNMERLLKDHPDHKRID